MHTSTVYAHTPIWLGNRLRGYKMIGYDGYQVNVIFTTVFRTLEEMNDWVLLLLTHWRLSPSWILLFSFHHLPFAGISLDYFPCSWSSQICTCAVAKKAAPPLTLPISGSYSAAASIKRKSLETRFLDITKGTKVPVAVSFTPCTPRRGAFFLLAPPLTAGWCQTSLPQVISQHAECQLLWLLEYFCTHPPANIFFLLKLR